METFWQALLYTFKVVTRSKSSLRDAGRAWWRPGRGIPAQAWCMYNKSWGLGTFLSTPEQSQNVQALICPLIYISGMTDPLKGVTYSIRIVTAKILALSTSLNSFELIEIVVNWWLAFLKLHRYLALVSIQVELVPTRPLLDSRYSALHNAISGFRCHLS